MMIGNDFSKYMNKPEFPVSVGDICLRTDYFSCDTEYRVIKLLEENNKYYALCEYKDEFSGELEIEKIYAYYLERKDRV